MTLLTKPVTRAIYLDPKLGVKDAGMIAVTSYPNGTIGFRKLKHHTEAVLPLSAAYAAALKAKALSDKPTRTMRRASRGLLRTRP